MQETLNNLLETSFRTNWNRAAVSEYKGKTLSYGEMAEMVCGLHAFFEATGVTKGEKISLCSRNQSNWGVVLIACLTYGAVPVPILHEFKAANIEFIVNHSGSRIFFVSAAVNDTLTLSAMPDVKAFVNMDDFSAILCRDEAMKEAGCHIGELFSRKFPDGVSKESLRFGVNQEPDELAIINYTSGTSGFSKGVMIPYRALLANISFARRELPELDNTAEVVAMLPSAHMYGMTFEFLYEMCLGCHVHFLTKTPSPSIVMKVFEEIRPSVIISVPLIIEKIYKKKIQPMLQKPGVRLLLRLPFIGRKIKNRINGVLTETFGGRFLQVIVGGAPFNREAEKFFYDIGFRFAVGYGMTECAPLISYSPWSDRKPGTCGRAIEGVEVRIDSADPARIPGEILVKGPVVMLGYYENEQATREAFTADGWLRTGDLGIMDRDGFIFIKGRSKSMILGPSGQNIYPEEIEDLLNNKPYVAESLVVDEKGRLVALIYPDAEGAQNDGLDSAAIERKMKDNVAAVNDDMPNYSKISSFRIMTEEFEKTPKRSIKRYLYQDTTV